MGEGGLDKQIFKFYNGQWVNSEEHGRVKISGFGDQGVYLITNKDDQQFKVLGSTLKPIEEEEEEEEEEEPEE